MTTDLFDFNASSLSPYPSPPSSPKRFAYLSAPSSPSRFYSQFDDFSSFSSTLQHQNDDFAFSVNRDPDSSPRSAEELFHDGKIKPLFESENSPLFSPNNQQPTKPPISKGKKPIIESFSLKNKNDSSNGERLGRDRTPSSEISFSKSGRRVSRSHSPYRATYTLAEEEEEQQQQQQSEINKEDSVPSSKSSRIWRLTDFLLFRSASEGRGTSKDPFRKYSVSYNKKSEEGKGSVPRSRRKEVDAVSAHELHYARKKAESEDLKKKTYLPYKQGILGKLAGLGSNKI